MVLATKAVMTTNLMLKFIVLLACIYYYLKIVHCKNVTGPAKRDQVGTKYTISQNGTYLEFYVQCLLSVGCKMLPMKLLIDGKNFTYIALAGH